MIDCLRFYETVPNTLGLAEKKIEILIYHLVIYYFINLLFVKFNIYLPSPRASFPLKVGE